MPEADREARRKKEMTEVGSEYNHPKRTRCQVNDMAYSVAFWLSAMPTLASCFPSVGSLLPGARLSTLPN